MEVDLSKISLTGWNPRKSFSGDGMNDLIVSIQEHGILEPLLVRSDGNGGFQLVAGERRFRAAQSLDLETVPVVVKDLTDQQVREIMLLENLQREDLTALEEAEALQQLLENGMTQQQVAQRIGKSQPWVANRLRLLEAPEDLKQMIISREITPKHAIMLLRYKEYKKLFKLMISNLKKTLDEEGRISVRRLESKIRSCIMYDAANQGIVFDLDPPDWEKPDWWDMIDFSECKTCKHAFKSKRYGEETIYCLYKTCYANKNNVAKHKYEKKHNREEASDNDLFDISHAAWDSYMFLNSANFDITECANCAFKKIENGSLERELCTNPACFKKKQRAHTRKINDAKRKEEAQVMKALDTYIMKKTKMTKKDLRNLLRFFAQVTSSVDHIKGMKKYGIKKWMDAGKIVDEVPDDELMTAILRILYARLMVGRYSSGGTEFISKKELEREVPEAVKYFKEEDES